MLLNHTDTNIRVLISSGIDTEEELRIAFIKNNQLYNLETQHRHKKKEKGNIYLARISHYEESLNAFFVDYGAERHGFLSTKDIAPSIDLTTLKAGQVLLIQVEKEQRSNKGAALTNRITLAGSFLVLTPNTPHTGGISRRIFGEERNKLREIFNQLNIPEGMGAIIRTAGIHRSLEALQWDLDLLVKHWHAIVDSAKDLKAPQLIHQEQNLTIQTIRDNLSKISEIVTDNQDVFDSITTYLEQVNPDVLNKVKLHTDPNPLFNQEGIYQQVETAFEHEVRLPSGGSIVFGYTEALVSIDVNSGRATKNTNLTATALNTNLEAATEIARQLRLRDIGGLIVIDFIDMSSQEHKHLVENKLHEATQIDRARLQIGTISTFGLLEVSRQRLRSGLVETSQTSCPHCHGRGMVHGIEALAISMIRLLQRQAVSSQKDNRSLLLLQLPVDVATFLFNEKRESIIRIEQQHNVTVVIIPNPHLQSPHFKIKRLKHEQHERKASGKNIVIPGHRRSYNLIDIPDTKLPYEQKTTNLPTEEQPVVEALTIPSKKHHPLPKKKSSLWSSLKALWASLWLRSRHKKKASRRPQHKYPSRSGYNRRRHTTNRQRRTPYNRPSSTNNKNTATYSSSPSHKIRSFSSAQGTKTFQPKTKKQSSNKETRTT